MLKKPSNLNSPQPQRTKPERRPSDVTCLITEACISVVFVLPRCSPPAPHTMASELISLPWLHCAGWRHPRRSFTDVLRESDIKRQIETGD